MLNSRFVISMFSIALMVLGSDVGSGQNYPHRSLRLVTQEAGGGTDFAARQIAQGLTGPLGQPVIVENRGGGGSISGEIVTNASPDGHTLLVTGTSFWVAPLFRKSPIKSGKLRAVAVTSARPSALYPELPAVAATVPGYESGGATAMFAPLRTPPANILRLNREVVRLLEKPDVKEKFFNVGVETVASSPEQLATAVKSETARLGKVIKDAGLRID